MFTTELFFSFFIDFSGQKNKGKDEEDYNSKHLMQIHSQRSQENISSEKSTRDRRSGQKQREKI